MNRSNASSSLTFLVVSALGLAANLPACAVDQGAEAGDRAAPASDGTSRASSAIATYCVAKGASTAYEWIERVIVGGKAVTTGNNRGYFEGTEPFELGGAAVPITLAPGFSSSAYPESFSVWIDADHDGQLAAQELVFSGKATSAAGISGTLSLPPSFLPGTTRMRVVMAYGAAPSPCVGPSYGEVEDYPVVLPQVVDAAPPAVVSVFPTADREQTLPLEDIAVTFSEALDPSSVTPDALVVRTSTGRAVPGTVRYEASDRSIRFRGETPLVHGSYAATVTSRVRDVAGNALGADRTWSFDLTGYCYPGRTDASSEHIARVVANGRSYTNDASGNFVVFTAPNKVYGARFDLELTPGFSRYAHSVTWRVWLDANRDGVFDPSEAVVTAQSAGTVRSMIDLPATAVAGKTHLRVAMAFNATPAACGPITWGQVEDIVLELAPPVVTDPWAHVCERHLAVGWAHTCARSGAGDVSCWGWNFYGQGNPPAGEHFETITAGQSHTCGLRSDGKALCWGESRDGRVAAPADGVFQQIRAGFAHTCGVRADRSAICWGLNDQGQSTVAPEERFTQISPGRFHTCGLRLNGSVVCWGDATFGRTTPPAGDGFVELTAHETHNCARKANGDVVCWGSTQWTGSGFVQIRAGQGQTCGVRADGSASCWGGASFYGEGDVPAGRTFDCVETFSHHACGRTPAGKILCWGESTSGQTSVPASFAE